VQAVTLGQEADSRAPLGTLWLGVCWTLHGLALTAAAGSAAVKLASRAKTPQSRITARAPATTAWVPHNRSPTPLTS